MSSEHEPKPQDQQIMAGAPKPTARALSVEDFILLNEEIAAMAKAGLPLDQGLSALAGEMGAGKLRSVTTQLADDMRGGLTLPQAVEKQAGRLPAYYARLLAAGIRAGKVTDVIGTLTNYARSMADMRHTIISALTYPVIVFVLSVILFGGVCLYIMPMFEEIFRGLNIRLPGITEAVFYVFRRPIQFFVLLPLGLLALFLAIRFLTRFTPDGRIAWTRFWYALPIVGELMRSARLAAFSDLLGILVDNGIPLPEAMLLAGQSSSDPLMATGAQQIHDGLTHGTPFATVLREQSLVPEIMTWMIGVGEKRGTLGLVLHQVAEIYHKSVDQRANLLRSVLPSFMVIFIAACVVVMFVLTLILPMVALLEGLGGGGGKK